MRKAKKQKEDCCQQLQNSIVTLENLKLGQQIEDMRIIRSKLPKNLQGKFIEPQMKLQMTDTQLFKIESDLKTIYNNQCKK